MSPQRVVGALIAALMLTTGCSSSATPPPSTSRSDATVQPSVAPLRVADCHHAIPDGSLPQADGTQRAIRHPEVTCSPNFKAIVDFTHLGDTPGCRAVAEAANPQGRPCNLPLRAQPDFAVPAYPAGTWAPVEGQDVVTVACQVAGNPEPSSGTLQNAALQRSNIWNKVVDPRLPSGFGWGNDLWFGNGGWRNVPCT
jgi:hypothetical protein